MGHTLGAVTRDHVAQVLGWPVVAAAMVVLGVGLLARRLRAGRLPGELRRPDRATPAAPPAGGRGRRLLAVSVSALSLTAVAACGGTDRTDASDVPLGPAGTLDVRTVGAVRVEPVAGGAPSMHREVHYDGAPPPAARVRDQGGTLVVEDCLEDCTSDLTLRVPSGTAVRVDSPTGPVSVAGMGSSTLRSASGAIDATAIRGDLDAEGDGAAVTARDVSGRARVVSQAGAVSAQESGGPVEATAGAGRVTVSMRGPADVVARSSAGDVEVALPPGPYDVQATDVDMPEIGVASTPGAPHRVSASTQAGQVRVTPRGGP